MICRAVVSRTPPVFSACHNRFPIDYCAALAPSSGELATLYRPSPPLLLAVGVSGHWPSPLSDICPRLGFGLGIGLLGLVVAVAVMTGPIVGNVKSSTKPAIHMRVCSAATYADNVALPAFARLADVRPCSNRSISPAGRQQSAMFARRTDGLTDAPQMHRPCCAYYAGCANNTSQRRQTSTEPRRYVTRTRKMMKFVRFRAYSSVWTIGRCVPR